MKLFSCSRMSLSSDCRAPLKWEAPISRLPDRLHIWCSMRQGSKKQTSANSLSWVPGPHNVFYNYLCQFWPTLRNRKKKLFSSTSRFVKKDPVSFHKAAGLESLVGCRKLLLCVGGGWWVEMEHLPSMQPCLVDVMNTSTSHWLSLIQN